MWFLLAVKKFILDQVTDNADAWCSVRIPAYVALGTMLYKFALSDSHEWLLFGSGAAAIITTMVGKAWTERDKHDQA